MDEWPWRVLRFLTFLAVRIAFALVFDVWPSAPVRPLKPAGQAVADGGEAYGWALGLGAVLGWGLTFVLPGRLIAQPLVPGISIVLAPALAAAVATLLTYGLRRLGFGVRIGRAAGAVALFAFALAVMRWFFVLD